MTRAHKALALALFIALLAWGLTLPAGQTECDDSGLDCAVEGD